MPGPIILVYIIYNKLVMGIWGFRDLKPLGSCDQCTYSSISGIRVRIKVGVHITDYLITINGLIRYIILGYIIGLGDLLFWLCIYNMIGWGWD